MDDGLSYVLGELELSASHANSPWLVFNCTQIEPSLSDSFMDIFSAAILYNFQLYIAAANYCKFISECLSGLKANLATFQSVIDEGPFVDGVHLLWTCHPWGGKKQ